MKATRRRFFAIAGATPLAAKATVDAEIRTLAGVYGVPGTGNGSLGLSYVGPPVMDVGLDVPYEKKIIGAADYIRMFGVPEVMEFELRDRARNVYMLDHDLACKRSWSMSVRLMTQRQRNYERELEKIKRSGWIQQGRDRLRQFLGYSWPW